MKITNIKLKNFRKHKDLSIDLSPLSTEIRKPNWWGKTTIADAIFYLFTDKPMTGEKNYSPKPMKDGEEVHGLDSIVSLTFDNGLVLTKTFSEKWETKRGSIDKLFTGNKTEYEINGVPKTKGEFERYIEDNIATKEQIQSLLNPSWWCDNKPTGYGWENRRTLLLEILGEVDESQILTEELKLILNGNPTDEAKKIFKATMKKINEEIKEIPNRIDEVSVALNGIERVNEVEVGNQINLLEKEIEDARLRISELSNEDNQTLALRTHLNALKNDLIVKKGIYMDKELQLKSVRNTPIRGQENRLDKLRDRNRKLSNELTDKQQQLIRINSNISRIQLEQDGLRKQYSKLKDLNFVPQTLSCPTCNQSLPVDQIKDMESKFNIDKSNKLMELQNKGQNLNIELERLDVEKNNINVDFIKSEINSLDIDILNVENTLSELKNNVVDSIPFEETEEYLKLKQEIDNQEELIRSTPSIDDVARPFKDFIKSKVEEQDKLKEKLTLNKTIQTYENRITELEDRNRELSEDYLQSEKALYLIERYEIEKVKLLDDAVNRTFDTLRFRMFKPNISNDGIQDTCDVLVLNESGLVPYQSASTSEKIRANFELIQALSNYWNIDLPIIVDNGEAIEERNRPVVNKQVLWLCVEV